MRITIASIDQKDKLSFITTTDGQKLRCWNDRAARFGLEENAGFEIETESTQYGIHIKTAKRAAAGPPAAQEAARPSTQHTPAPASKDEQIFVQGILQALIRSGEVTNDRTQIGDTVKMLRGIFRQTFGREAMH